jgi:ubiquitin carboxyl-terminal hydrolase 5/13
MLGMSKSYLSLIVIKLTMTSHYVAFVRKTIPGEDKPSWVLFNDEKVAKAGDIDEMKKFAYVYFFRRT